MWYTISEINNDVWNKKQMDYTKKLPNYKWRDKYNELKSLLDMDIYVKNINIIY